ncbi:SpoIIE family protein phosphatase [Streptomyces sp. WMMB 322]|uniref:ATP-binding SpoIIE family protein phosphatase n=1 Tax=Streptomyces sp. WMMB 322 TaxID=1286821 RepID=UPI0006E348CA|nr:SpoIIE family protein phosphatase [Streptomyces sp. WMMB 322]SCK13539.1 PAS domain S-box-containing protein [Streptomyces sp. WMMB 322]
MTRQDTAASRRDEPWESDDAATPATAVLDERGRVTAWSEGARRLLGHRREEIVGRDGAELLAEHADQPDGPAPGTRSWSGHAVLRHRNGFDVRVGLLARRRETPSGAEWLVVRVAGSRLIPHQDETLMRWGFGEFPCILALFDTDLLLVRANADMERAVGLTQEQLQGLRPSEMLSAQPEPGSVEEAMREAMRKDERRHLSMFLWVPGEDREHAWSVWVAPSKDENGRLRGVCFSAQEQTEQYAAQQRLLVLNKAGTRIGTTLDISRTAQQLSDVAVPEFADFVSVDLLTFLERGEEPPPGARAGPVVLRRAGQRSVTGGKPEDLVVPGDVITYPQLSALVQSLDGRRTTTADASRDLLARWAPHDPERSARLRSQGIHSVMVVPMRARGLLLGVTVFMRHRRPEPFSEDDMLLAEELTARAGVSLDNARRYIAERNRAETLQRDLLPQRLPELTAVETAARYLPAREQAGVGGDWFDVIPLSSARVALVVGDVVGHGLQASGAMARFRTAVRALADMGLPPDELLTRLDDMVTRLSDEDGAAGAKYIGATCLYAVYDPVSRLCTAACAGHPLPLVVGPSGEVEVVGLPTGPPLGVGGMPFEVSERELPEGSVLAFYTNGLIETRDRDMDEGLELFRRTLAGTSQSLEAACNHVVATLLRDPPRDDAALLLARTRELSQAQVATWDLPADPAVVARIRDDVACQMSRWELEELAFSTELVVSELVTNAIRYGQSPIRLRLIHDRELICEVSDTGIAAPHLRPAGLMDEGGRGLLLVAQLCRRWGVRYGAQGKTIWAEQNPPGDHSPPLAM